VTPRAVSTPVWGLVRPADTRKHRDSRLITGGWFATALDRVRVLIPTFIPTWDRTWEPLLRARGSWAGRRPRTEAARRAVQLSGGRGVHTAALAAYPHPHEMIVQIQCVRFMLSEELLECQQGDECRA
jgi:hypothetical protein